MFKQVALRLTILNATVFSLVVITLLATVFFSAERMILSNADNDLRDQVESFGVVPDFDLPIGIPSGMVSIAEVPFTENYSVPVDSGLVSSGFGSGTVTMASPTLFDLDRPVTISLQGSAIPIEANRKSFLFITDTEEHPLISSFASITALPVADAVGEALQGNTVFNSVSIEGENFRVATGPVRSSVGITGAVQVGQSSEVQDQIISTLRNVMLGAGGLGLVISGIAGYVLASRTLRPVQTAMQRQKAFIADASHELRTPVTIIRSHAEELEQLERESSPANPGTQSQLVREIREETEYLTDSISRLLDLAQLDAKGEAASVEMTDVVNVTASALRAVGSVAESKGLSITPMNAAPVVKALADPEQLRCVLLALLDNAIKYNRSGGEIVASVTAIGSGAEIVISDTGIGIPPEHIDRVTERFHRVDGARGHSTGGVGLGLSIASETIQSFGGTLRLESAPNAGTNARISLVGAAD